MLVDHSQGLNAAALRHRLASSDDQVPDTANMQQTYLHLCSCLPVVCSAIHIYIYISIYEI